MEKLVKSATGNTPNLELDHTAHTLTFEGESRPEDTRKFYAPVFTWLDEYKNYLFFVSENANNGIKVNVNFKLEYFNSSSAKAILDILTQLCNIVSELKNTELIINWYYEPLDEDMRDSGVEFEKLVGQKFNLLELK